MFTQSRSTPSPGLSFGLALAFAATVGCGGGQGAPKDGINGSIAFDAAAPQTFDKPLNYAAVGAGYQVDSDSLLGAVRIQIIETTPAAATTGTFGLTGGQHVSARFAKIVGTTWEYSPATTGTIEITHVPTGANPVWSGVIRNMSGAFSGGPTVSLTEADFRITFATGWIP